MYLLSYKNGLIGYGLPRDLDEAMEEAVYRCGELDQTANIVERSTYRVAAEIKREGLSFKAVKKD